MRIALTLFFLWTTIIVFGQIRVNNPVQDLGDVFEGNGIVKSKFKLQNPYLKDTIRITHIETSCGCTAILSEDTLILPQSAIDLEFAYDPKGRLGLFVKSIEVHTLTGKQERNKLYLKIVGNVIGDDYEKTDNLGDLLDYHVVPIHVYPVSNFDTSYFAFNYIGDFVNDLTYEIDYHQFTTIGFNVAIQSIRQVEQLEKLLTYAEQKIIREFKRRGYSELTVFFESPHFTIDTTIPKWASARVEFFSVNFNDDQNETSQITLAQKETEQHKRYLINMERFNLPTNEEVIEQLNFDLIESKYFIHQKLDLNGSILMPWKKSKSFRKKVAKELEKSLKESILLATGGKKSSISITFDSLGIHSEDKYQINLWDVAELPQNDKIKYIEKQDNIQAPFLPTYKQFLTEGYMPDTIEYSFVQFWTNLVLNAKKYDVIDLLIESSASTIQPEKELLAKNWGEDVAHFLSDKFHRETGKKLNVQFIAQVRGPEFKPKKNEQVFFDEYDYINLVPLVNPKNKELSPAAGNIGYPYQVNFDYYFNGIDTRAWGFKRFATSIAEFVEENGYIKLAIESSISQIRIEDDKSNDFIAYSRLEQSERRLKEALASQLIDPNRILFVQEKTLEQGPKYDGSIPIKQYRKFHYIKIQPLY
jgi:hypothetical protein